MTGSNGSRGSLSDTAEPQPTDTAAHPHPPPAVPTNTNGDHRPAHPAFTSRSGINIHSLATSRSPSTGASPRSSRDSSPAGRAFRQQSSGASATGMRSRKDSHDASPHRPPSITGHAPSVPSAAAIQRALSAAATPQLQPSSVTESTSKIPRSRAATSTSGEGTPAWPASPRLKSPPPSSSRRDSLRSSQRAPDIAKPTPSIVVQRSTPMSSTDNLKLAPSDEAPTETESQNTAQAKVGNRSAPTLETVQEAASMPPTPVNGTNPGASSNPNGKYFDVQSEEDGQPTPRSRTDTVTSGPESGSDNDRTKKEEDIDPDSTPRAKSVIPRTSFSSLKPKSGVEPTTKNMTVETETVTSIPQSTLGAPSDRVASGRTELGGTLRVKASNETIRPGKGRKKASRKAPSINATSASTRADIFEDRVKNAMDEATSDDSDETFVYESNPPEPPVRRSRHHSRTPSGASATSQADQRVPARSLASALSTQKTRSMKFANAYSSGADEEALERQDGTIRASNARNGASSIHHHHLGRPNRNGTGHTSILDDDNSPFPPLNKTRSLTGMPGRASQNARLAARHLQVSNGSSRKGDGYTSYDMDAEGGDDERTPLIGTVRTPRSARRSTLQTARVRYPDQYPVHQRSLLSRFAGFIVLVVMLLLLAFGVVGFLFAISKPLEDVTIMEIQAVLASEQEIMFDLAVGSVNPNLLPINIADMDIHIFAKSKYVGSEKWWREHGNETMPRKEKGSRRKSRTQRLEEYREADFDSPENDGNSKARQTMLLGRVDHFDNPLTFDGSFWKRHVHFSTGSLRLSRPGNRSELGGTERWERVLLHPFDLIVRGTLKYKIPLGGKSYTADVKSNTTVVPDDTINTPGDHPWDTDGRITD